MSLRRTGYLAAGLWTILRFVMAYLLTGGALEPEGPFLDILWPSVGTLTVSALFLVAAFIPHYQKSYLPLMRLSILLFVLTDAAVVLGGSVVSPDSGGDPPAGLFLITFGILVIDLLLLAALLSFQRVDRNGEMSKNEEDDTTLRQEP